MIVSRCHGQHIGSAHDGYRSICPVPPALTVSQLAESIVTHRPQGAVRLQEKRMVLSSRYRDYIAGHGYRNGMTHVGNGMAPIAQLAVPVVAHRPQGAV